MKDTEAYHMLAKEMMHVHDLYYIGRVMIIIQLWKAH